MSLTRSFLSRRSASSSSARCFSLSRSRSRSSSLHPAAAYSALDGGDARWSSLLPELLADIISRVEKTEDRWPSRRDVVSCACVCKRWRDVAKQIVNSPLKSGKITFPSCLKQPGPRDNALQCLIKRDKKNSTFYLYLSVSPSSFTEKGKFLLAAKRYRRGAHSEFIVSLSADDLSQGSSAYVGKLRYGSLV
ncbi:hypothetical protein KSS87_010260 [Heliosperma pusillum]|nr:hypothetical protein KSS87_010260 [Heliosperma pusillum]